MKLFLGIFIITVVLLETESSYVTQEPCKVTEYVLVKTYTSTWIIFRRTEYRAVRREKCCPDYGGSACNIPKCGGGAVQHSCSLEEGRVVHKNGTVITHSNGTCAKPYNCTNCNEGYYATTDNSGYCKACRPIENCNIPSCTEYNNTYCAWCVGELRREVPGYNLFTGKPDNMQCQRACSWRDGYRCFPGTCTGDMLFPQNCKCAVGFTGKDCATATGEKLPIILEQILVFEGDGDIKKFLMDKALMNGRFWTNQPVWSTVAVNVSSTYKPEIDTENIPNYIFSYNIGIENITVTCSLYRGNKVSNWTTSTQHNCNMEERCSFNSKVTLQQSPWNSILSNNSPAAFKHLDRVNFTVSTKSGGVIRYTDRENETEGSYSLTGDTTSDTLELWFDLINPTHCFETSNSCSKDSLTINDINNQSHVRVYWDGWSDDDSGLEKYIFNTHYLAVKNQADPKLEPSYMLPEVTVNSNTMSTFLNLSSPGPYSVEINAVDKAGNHKISRRIIFYDNSSIVDKTGPPPVVTQANNFWINETSENIEIRWTGRYINTRHHSLGWLNEVKDDPNVIEELDDTSNRSFRNKNKLRNIQGIVRFEIAYKTEENGIFSYVDFSPVPEMNFESQNMIYQNVALTDGKKVTYSVRGFDVFNSYAEDNITVMIDLSPPIIQNLWLTKGSFTNVSVHNNHEFKNITFEFEVHDRTSGLYEIKWRIFDNFTGSDFEHGQSYQNIQGNVQTLEECNEVYREFPGSPVCYCTPYNGCYQQRHKIKPQVTNTGSDGIHSERDTGVHDHDYFIEVTAINNAGLTTVLSYKLTIDVSPPNEGTVHDGIFGEPEVDFQQSLQLSAYWDGFFDKESGVWFYMYAFDKECLRAEDFDVHNPSVKTFTSYGKSATVIMETPGKYYVTVVAYNHALDPSKPVCSDGVTIDFAPANISEVVVKGALTLNGVIKDALTGHVYVLKGNREIEQIGQPTQECIQKATLISHENILMIPHKRHINGTKRVLEKTDCSSLPDKNSDILSYVTSASHLEVSWNISLGAAGLYDFEIGIASTDSVLPDIMSFKTTHGHQHSILYHPNLFTGESFFIVIKAITKSAVIDIKTVGPFAAGTPKPEFRGSILLDVNTYDNDTFLTARWDKNAFVNEGDPNPLTYEIATGTQRDTQNVFSFQQVSFGGSCTYIFPINCAAIKTDLLPWHLHAMQTYYVAIKATNTIGRFVIASSEKYTHIISKASSGVVHDIDALSNTQLMDIDDIDYQIHTDQLSARWFGFEHPFETIKFHVCITKNASLHSTLVCENADAERTHTFTGLTLENYQTYYVLVIAETEAGNVTAVSDGVTVVVEGDKIDGILVYDGLVCVSNTVDEFKLEDSHHSEDKRLKCDNDKEYQSSFNSLQAHWTLPKEKHHYLKSIFWAVEERAPVVDEWKLYKDYVHIKTNVGALEDSEITLTAGRRYRILLKICAEQICFAPVKSSGVTIIPTPPQTGSVRVRYLDQEKKLAVHLGHFKDPDIEDTIESRDAIDHYEWALTDSSINSNLLTKWKRVLPDTFLPGEITFFIDLQNEIQFTKCWKVAVKGYSKAGLSSTVSTDIRNCSVEQQIKPNIVIDAIGKHSKGQANLGEPIYLEENALWPYRDADYTSFSNILSAVWPALRHKNYTWAVLVVREEDATILYKQVTALNLQDPCSHPDAVKCGNTDLGFVNINFEDSELTHGHRYIICVHANATRLQHEFWTQYLPEVNECSDGVTVDLTPPQSGDAWLSNDKGTFYQTSKSELSVNWNSFIDVEEEGHAVHTSGVKRYEVAIGTTYGGTDVIPFTDVGLTNHKTFHRMHLINGQTYFASVKGYDFTGQSSVSYSHGVTVDISPPVIKDSRINVKNRHITSTEYVNACWVGKFSDPESGISHYSWSVGSQVGYDNIMSYVDTLDECSSTPEDQALSLTEGHAYFINVKAYNNARQYSVATSWAFIVDSSEPIAGYVFDGSKATDTEYIDLDYIDTSSRLHVRWKGFHDPHTSIKEYFVSVSCRFCAEVMVKQPNGLTQYAELRNLQLAEGVKYFVTVTACNTAELCTSASSDGFIMDSTPPVQGYVIDGTFATDIQYQSTRNYVGCKWFGFNDPQSQIANYVWRVGTAKGGDDIVPATNCHNAEEAFLFDLTNSLPVNMRVYCTVRAYSKAGKYVESWSNGFIVDTTPPTFKKQLTLSPIGSTKDGTSVLRSLIRVNWLVEDKESFIERQFLSISSHIGGDFNLSSVQVEGILRDYTFTDLDLHDGSYYDIKLISCNGAKLCTESILQNVLVDSSPPSSGAFAINTDHSAVLNRQPDGWMRWTDNSVSLAWLGFQDLHTGVHSYSINIGSQYMSDDLNEFPSVPNVILHSGNAPFFEDGFVQTITLNTQSLTNYSAVYISIVAKNNAGLSSEILHAQLNLIHGGILELVRRCESQTCLGHCVCAPPGQACTVNDEVCVDTSGMGTTNTLIEIQDFIDIRFPEERRALSESPINTMLAGKWTIKTLQGKRPQWYECSAGESTFDTPQGIFHETFERVWYDAGLNTECIFTFNNGELMAEREKYSVFVRVFYDRTTFAVFKSPGVIIHSTPPTTSILFGRNVKEVVAGGTNDIDFITQANHLYTDWSGKFVNTGGELWFYHIYISTSPGGHDTYSSSTNIPSSVTRYNITGLTLEEKTRYYTTIQAYNRAGLHSVAVSDGFMLDLKPPTPGVVMDGKALSDLDASNDSHLLSAFWHGFSDLESGIMAYEYCVSSEINDNECNILPVSDVGILLRTEHYSSQSFPQGVLLKSKVKARDAAGHVSEAVSSNGLIIDSTPAERIRQSGSCSTNILSDSSFEYLAETQNDNTSCIEMTKHKWKSYENSCVSVLRSGMAYDGQMAVIIQGDVQQLVHIENKGKYRLTFYTSAVKTDSLQISSNEGYIDINGETHIFFLYEKPTAGIYKWQKHTFFFLINDSEITLSIGTLRQKAAFALDNIKLEYCQQSLNEPANVKENVNAHTVFVHDWSSLHADWTFSDPETDIIEYIWAIGTVEGGTQLQDFTNVGRRTYGTTHSLHLEHNTTVFVTVVAMNEAHLRTVSYSNPIKIDLTPPEFRYIYDGNSQDRDIDFQIEPEIKARWEIFDFESGVTECSWAIGISPKDTSIQGFVPVSTNGNNARKVLDNIPDKKIYVTVICKNGAGLTSMASTDGVNILQAPPSADGVILELMTTSETQFSARDNYHGNKSEIKFRWTGFSDGDGVDRFLVGLKGKGVVLEETVPYKSTGYNYASFTNLDLKDGEYTVSVTAVNEIQMYSERKTARFYLLTKAPSLTGKEVQTSWIQSTSTAIANWENVFYSKHPLFYEVTVRLADDGKGDILQWQETSDTELEVKIENDVLTSEEDFKIVFSVRAVSFSGLFMIRHADLLVTVA